MLCALVLVFPAAVSAKKKKPNASTAPSAGAAAAGIQRSMCGFELGSAITDPEKQEIRDVTAIYQKMLPEGDRMFSVQAKLEPGSSGCLLQVFSDRVWRIQASYPPNFTKTHDWAKMVKANSRQFGEPEKTEQTNEKFDRLKLVWKDDKTRMADTREVRGKDSGVDIEHNAVYYQFAIEDIGLSMRQVKAEKTEK